MKRLRLLPMSQLRMILLAIALATPSLVFAEAVTAQVAQQVDLGSQSSANGVVYTIHQGDTLYTLAHRFGTTVETLIAMNRITNPRTLQIGQAIEIPDAAISAMASVSNRADAAEKVIICTLTAYTNDYASTGKHLGDPGYGITATGTKAAQGRTVAVDPQVIPLGSQVYIDGIGVRTAEDTGGLIKGDRLDVFYNDEPRAIQFGVKKNVKVYILSAPGQN